MGAGRHEGTKEREGGRIPALPPLASPHAPQSVTKAAVSCDPPGKARLVSRMSLLIPNVALRGSKPTRLLWVDPLPSLASSRAPSILGSGVASARVSFIRAIACSKLAGSEKLENALNQPQRLQ